MRVTTQPTFAPRTYARFYVPDCRHHHPTIELGLTITGAGIDERHTWITCRPVTVDTSCPGCGDEGRLRDHRIRELVHLAADKLTLTRQRIQQDTCGHRGRSGDTLYGVGRILLTRMGLLTDKQKAKLDAVFADERHTAVDVTHWTYQDIIAAYEHLDRRVGKRWMYKVMCRIRKDLPAGV